MAQALLGTKKSRIVLEEPLSITRAFHARHGRVLGMEQPVIVSEV